MASGLRSSFSSGRENQPLLKMEDRDLNNFPGKIPFHVLYAVIDY